MSVETHEALRKLPITELGAALAVAIIDNARDREPISAVYGLIATVQVMAEHLSPVDRILVVLEMHRAAIAAADTATQADDRQNGRWIELAK